MKEQMVYINYKDKEYPMIFTLNCMETIQEKYGSMEAWMEELGKKDENGEKAEPNIKLLKFGLGLMINEAIDIENEDKEEVHLGIRPEFFTIDENGPYQMDVEFVEYIGRDKTVIFRLPGIKDKTFKCIISSGILIEPDYSYKFKLNKYYIFTKDGRRVK